MMVKATIADNERIPAPRQLAGLRNAALLATPNIILVHTPVHASWLNQVETYFSIIQRKVLTPNDFSSLTAVKNRLLSFQERYEQSAKPFQWTFTRSDLHDLLAKLDRKSRRLAA